MKRITVITILTAVSIVGLSSSPLAFGLDSSFSVNSLEEQGFYRLNPEFCVI